MISVQGVYDGKSLKLFDKIQITSPKKVIITFLDDPKEDITTDEIQYLVQEGGAFDFLAAEEEDLYSDNDLKTKY